LSAFSLGGSLIYLTKETIDFFCEVLWVTEQILSDKLKEKNDSFLVNPAVRYAINFDSGLQIVPGLAYPYDIKNKGGSVSLYLSFEHPAF
jgi:hypothetical protein